MRKSGSNRFAVAKYFLQILISSFAFLIVAFLAAIAGYALSAENFSFRYLISSDLLLILTYILLLWPYYVSRHGLIERKLNDQEHPIDIDSVRYGIQAPAYTVIVVGFIALLAFGNYFSDPRTYAELQVIVASLFLGFLPFFIVFIESLRDLASEKRDRAFEFTSRILYPALCTGIVPFAFGWSISGPTININVIFWASIYLILLIYTAKFKVESALTRVVVMLVLVLLAFTVIMREELKVILLGSVITLAMIVSESSKRVYLARKADRFYPTTQQYQYYLAGSNWSSIVFLWLLSLVPLVIKELSALPFLIFIAAQSLIWFFSSKEFKWSKNASILSLLFGYGLPLIIILTRIMKLPATFLTDSIKPSDISLVFSLIDAILLTFLVADIRFRNYVFSPLRFRNETYLDRKNNYYLFFIVVTAITIISVSVGVLSTDPQIKTKAAETIGVGTLLSLILLVFYFRGDDNIDNGVAKENKKD